MAESLRIQQLKSLAGSLPVANQQVAQGLKAAQDIQLKGSIKSMPQGAGPGAAQQLGAQQQQAQGKIALQTNQQTAQQTGQVAQLGQAQKSLQDQQQLGQQARQVSGKQREFQDRLSNLSSDLKNKLLDEQLTFKTDERGRTFFNDRQLADWAATQAKSAEEFANYQQTVEQASQRKLAMMEQAQRLLQQQLDQAQRGGAQALNQQQTIRLAQQKAAMEKKIAQERADAANRGGTFGAAGMIAGTAIGAAYGGPAGAMIGGQIGGGLGQAAAGATQK